MGRWVERAWYVQVSKSGVFRYRRVLPPAVRALAGKREILVSLRTKDPNEAELRYLKVHLSSVEWLASLIDSRGRVSANPPSRLTIGLRNNAADGHDAALRRAPVRNDTLTTVPVLGSSVTLNGALSIYLKEKAGELGSYRGRQRQTRYDEKRRVIRYLCAALSSDREVASLSREDARTFRDYLLKQQLAPASVAKNIGIAAAIIQAALDEFQLAVRNPFHRFRVVNDVAAVDARLPLDSAELQLVRTLPVNPELLAIACLLIATGARLNEIAGLQWADVKLDC